MVEQLNMDKFIADLVRDEGIVLKPYMDSVGKLTIGIGRNLEDNGITEDEALFLAKEDANRARRECRFSFGFWDDLSERRKRALANMCFNLGLPRLLNFKKMILALENGYYDQAADEALDSAWARQVGERAQRIARAFREG